LGLVPESYPMRDTEGGMEEKSTKRGENRRIQRTLLHMVTPGLEEIRRKGGVRAGRGLKSQ